MGADRFCVCDPYRGGNTTVGAKVNGADCSSADEAAERRYRRDFDAGGACSEPRLAEFYEELAARNKIKHWLNEHQRERAIEIGKKLLDREARKYKLALSKFGEADYDRVAGDYGLGTQAELLSGVGFGKFQLGRC